MATFDFNDGGVVVNASSVAFNDTGVNFTISTVANPGGNQISYSPTIAPDGSFTMSDFGTLGAFTFDVAGTEPSQFFQGNGLQLEIGTIYSGNWNVTFVSTAGDNVTNNVTVVNVTSNQIIDLGASSKVFSEIRFTPTSAGGMTVDSLNATLLCFLEGTMIATPDGEKAVEALQAGDVVMTATGGTTTVAWLGEQPVATATTNPAKVNPIRIRAGALGDMIPARDLLVSPDHAIGIDGYLVNASALINGSTITREGQMPGAGFTYFHVETGTHELLLAEGCPAETYVDFIGRDGFVNWAERTDAPAIAEMAAPRISAARHLPAPIRARLEGRAEALGLNTRAA
ncbi:Hint domain-containing protein [Antarctobacter heliothermus]|uniref:Hint domain-containing protein n=1 Tax=Antarctobacter heliothermus TaxID=74033 RepID=A0A239HW29_9RHOB|nr:Hint domain-containing protein [Antarctobacter heliothermus]SNS85451.1 Hint domain-containing protein [Antarctobacter heliothermus]